MEPIRRTSVVDRAVDQLRGEILGGRWPVGGRIPTETALTTDLGVSRPSVREAVRALVQLGLLEVRQGDGTYVIALDPTEVALRRALDSADSRDVRQVRRALDVLAAREAASHRRKVDIKVLAGHLDRRMAAIESGDTEAFADHDVAFHLGIAEASGNHLLAALYRCFDASLRQSVAEASSVARGADPDQANMHASLLRAIEAGDPEAAAAASLGVLDEEEHLLTQNARGRRRR